ncbi:MAG: Gldg family protein [Pirellulales bacterium]
MNWNVLRAIFKRNFISYFASPTGYVFICVFVLLTSLAAFWPNDFFNSNLANLDQLSKYLPYIMLVFIPAITMSIWAEERRLGTDELLLTIPASDVDVVLGKYLAAVAIFTVSLLFSAVANFTVLQWLGNPDLGLFFGTYLGYWFVGLAMLAVGMVASFLTSNLTVGFVLGALFNAPLAFSGAAEVILPPSIAQYVSRWSVARQIDDFERGMISLSSISYFVLIAAVMLYLSVVLIGRRHWRGGRDGKSMLGHYVARTIALLLVAVGVSVLFADHDLIRADVTTERLSSLSPDTRQLVQNLDTEYPVKIEAYISADVPSEYIQTKLDLISTLGELSSLGGEKILVQQHILENHSEAAADAQAKYGIEPQTVLTKVRGAQTQEEVFLGVAFTCGLEKEVVPFIDKGIPVEYELVRSITTVAQQERKRLGVVKTDVPLLSSFNFQAMSNTDESLLVQELRKQYEVVEVDPASPITDQFDVLLAVQPSSLGPEEMNNFIAAVESGQPTAIFEDPFPMPNFYPNVPGTAQPKQPQQTNPFMGSQPPQPKGDITRLWDVLGVDMVGDQVIWQDYNPYPRAGAFIDQAWVFIDDGSGEQPFNQQQAITAGLQQVLFIMPGAWRRLNASNLEFIELARTGDNTGTTRFADIMQNSRMGVNPFAMAAPTEEQFVLAARVQGEAPEVDPAVDSAENPASEVAEEVGGGAEETPAGESEGTAQGGQGIDVVLVSDIDCLASAFFFVRSRGQDEGAEINFQFDNVTFVLNALDVLADDPRFVEIRKRRRAHRTLTQVEDRTEQARREAAQRSEEFNNHFEQARTEEQQKFNERIDQIQKNTGLDARTKMIQVEVARSDGQRKLEVRLAQLRQERDRAVDQIERTLSGEISRVQNRYKLFAVLIPPLPPLLLAGFVFFHRRNMEREGVSKSRLR